MEKLELTVAQKSFLDLEYLFPNECTNNIHIIMFPNYKATIDLINNSFKTVLNNNDVFNLLLDKHEDNYYLYHKAINGNKAALDLIDFTNNKSGYENWLIGHQTMQLFSLHSKLYYACIVISPDGEVGFSFLAHHMLHDAFSIYNMFMQISKLAALNKENDCEAITAAVESPSYVQYMIKNNSATKSPYGYDYWKNKIISYQGNPIFAPMSSNLTGETKNIPMSEEISHMIRDYCTRNGLSIFNMLLGSMLLCKYTFTKRNSVEIGIPILNRVGNKEKRTLGLFTNVLPLFTEIDFQMSIESYFNNLRVDMNDFYKHRYSSYEEIKKMYEEITGQSPGLFEIILSYQKIENIYDLEKKSFKVKWVDRHTLVNPLLITILDFKDSAFIVRCEYRSEIVSGEFLEKVTNKLFDIIKIVTYAQSDKRLRDIKEKILWEENQLSGI